MDVLLLPALDGVWSLKLRAAERTEVNRRVNPNARHLALVLLTSAANGKHENALGLADEIKHALVSLGECLAESVAA